MEIESSPKGKFFWNGWVQALRNFSHAMKGDVRFIDLKTVINRDGEQVVMNRNGSIAITDEKGRERERNKLIYGARLRFWIGETVNRETLLAEWDPYTIPIITDVSGKVKFGDVIEGLTMNEQVDEVTGLSRKVIVEYKKGTLRSDQGLH